MCVCARVCVCVCVCMCVRVRVPACMYASERAYVYLFGLVWLVGCVCVLGGIGMSVVCVFLHACLYFVVVLLC